MTGVQTGLEQKPGVQLTAPGEGRQYLDTVELTRPAVPTSAEALPMCAAQIVRNKEVTLSDSAGSFFGAYTGQYYQVENARQAGGDNSGEYISPDGKKLVTKGAATYSKSFAGLPQKMAATYLLTLKPADNKMRYTFTDIQQAQLDTGAASNEGFYPVGAWSGANPIAVYNQLAGVADKMNSCISNQR